MRKMDLNNDLRLTRFLSRQLVRLGAVGTRHRTELGHEGPCGTEAGDGLVVSEAGSCMLRRHRGGELVNAVGQRILWGKRMRRSKSGPGGGLVVQLTAQLHVISLMTGMCSIAIDDSATIKDRQIDQAHSEREGINTGTITVQSFPLRSLRNRGHAARASDLPSSKN